MPGVLRPLANENEMKTTRRSEYEYVVSTLTSDAEPDKSWKLKQKRTAPRFTKPKVRNGNDVGIRHVTE